MSFISPVSASIFVGPELAANPHWQDLTITYTVNRFTAVAALRQWSAFVRPFVHRFLPCSKICKDQAKLANEILVEVLHDRARIREHAIAASREPIHHEDTLIWVSETTTNHPIQSTTAPCSSHSRWPHCKTTSEAFRQILLDLCVHSDLLASLHAEIESLLSARGRLGIAALSKLHLLNSVMKESQRRYSTLVGIERRAVRDTVMPPEVGLTLPVGSKVAVESSDMFNAAVHENLEAVDGSRFLRLRGRGQASTAAFVSSYKEHNVFGAGQFVCPGQFFVENELKIVHVHVLMEYDVRIRNRDRPGESWSGFYCTSDLGVSVEVKRLGKS